MLTDGLPVLFKQLLMLSSASIAHSNYLQDYLVLHLDCLVLSNHLVLTDGLPLLFKQLLMLSSA